MTASVLSKERADQIAGGVFLIGLALIFATKISFFPGILFVIGASSLARGLAEGRQWYSVQGALWMIGLGLLFLLGFNFPLLLILIGLSLLFGFALRPPRWRGGDAYDADETSPSEAAQEVAAYGDEYDEKPKRKRKNDEV